MMTAARIHPNGRINFSPMRERGHWWLTRRAMRVMLGRVPRKPVDVWLVETPQGRFQVQQLSHDRVQVVSNGADFSVVVSSCCRPGFEARVGRRTDGVYPFNFEILTR